MRPVATASGAGTPKKRISNGVVIVPAPTPVRAMKTAIINPMEYSMRLLSRAMISQTGLQVRPECECHTRSCGQPSDQNEDRWDQWELRYRVRNQCWSIHARTARARGCH